MRNEVVDARIRMAMAPGLGPLRTRMLEEHFDSPVQAVHATVADLRQLNGIGDTTARQIRQALDEADVDREWQLIERQGAHVVSIDDEQYPTLLRHIHDPPPLLYVRGELTAHDAVALAVVGSRKCTMYGREQADRLSAAAAQSGLTILSGGARGIDTASHRAALRVKGRTIAVLGCGLAECYPPDNRELFEEIAGGGGAIVTELPMSAPPIAENFPRRNRIISGMALGVLVVEAAVRSGALITARLAAEEHHREVMAIPGRIDSAASAGCHRIIREGWATLVTNAADLLDALGETGQLLRGAMEQEQGGRSPGPFDGEASRSADAPPADSSVDTRTAGLNDAQRQLYDAITPDPIELDQLARQLDLPMSTVHSHLTLLQLRGLVQRVGGGRVRRRSGGS